MQKASSRLQSSPEPLRRRLRPYTDPSYADELMHSDEYASSHTRRPSAEQERGLRSFNGKRKIGGTSESRLDSGVTSATSVASDSRIRQMRDRSRSQNHVHFVFPPSSSSSTLAATSQSIKSPSKEGGQADQVGNMLIGDMGTDVNRVWQEAKEKEKTSKTQRRIAELESEVQRLKSEVSVLFIIAPRKLNILSDGAEKCTAFFYIPPRFFVRFYPAEIPLQIASSLDCPSSSASSASPTSYRQGSNPSFSTSGSLHCSSIFTRYSSSSFA